MSATEIDLVAQRFRARLEQILSPADLAAYDAYHERIRAALARDPGAPVETTPAERAVLEQIEADTEAAALNKQFFALIRVERLPQ